MPPNDDVVRQLHKLQTAPEMERIMSAEDLFEIEQQRIHEDLAQALFESEKLRKEEQRHSEELERENARLRPLLRTVVGARFEAR